MKKLAERAINELAIRYESEFVILYGSIARGDYTEDSDIDVALFCESPKISHDVSFFEGKQLDCWLYSVVDANPERAAFLRLAGGELYLDKKGTGKEFFDCVNSKFNAGPTPISADSREHLVEWCKKMLVRAGDSDIEAKFRRTELPCVLLEIYFKLRNLWFTGSKSSFNWLEKNDIDAYKKFEEIFSDPTNVSVLSSLVDSVTNTKTTVTQENHGQGMRR